MTGAIKKSGPSKIYAILKSMQENGFIMGEEKYHDGKKVTFYEITDNGKMLLFYI